MDELSTPGGEISSDNKEILSYKKYECKICFKTFKTKQEQKVHIRTHTGQKHYTCTTCQKSF